MNVPIQKTAYLGLGSNLGDKKTNLELALQQIQLFCGLTTKVSKIHETEAWGYSDQPSFYNQVLELLTPLGAEALLQKCLEIELNMGRLRGKVWGERIIDIDILFFNNESLHLPNLQIPHPYLHQRRFVLVPLVEIAPYIIHPLMGLNAQQLLDQCTDSLKTTVVE